MREIKFRAYNKVEKVMYTDAINNCKDSFDMILKHPQIYDVMQYMGLKDKNGAEIYEGDIISCGDGNVPTLIKWHDESHAYYAYNIKRKEYHRLDKFFIRYIGEIIGNIHDHPELLEG